MNNIDIMNYNAWNVKKNVNKVFYKSCNGR